MFALVKIDVAAHCLNRSVQKIFDLVDGGTADEAGLLWVFNLATKPHGHRRELRFWNPELVARAHGEPAKYHRHTIDFVISQILPGDRESFNSGFVDGLLQVRPRTRLDYHELPGRRASCGHAYQRPLLERFLRQRWLGNSPATQPVAPCRTFTTSKAVHS